MPFFPYLPIIAIVCQIILAVWLIHMSIIAWIIAPAWIITGVLIYHLYSKSHTVSKEHEIQIIEEETVPETSDYRVMVAVANPKNAIRMVNTTRELCKAKNAQSTDRLFSHALH